MFNKLTKWVKDLYYTQQRKPNEPEITYQKQVTNIIERRDIVFPDGEVLTLERHGNSKYWQCRYDGILCEIFPNDIPDFSEWQPPMVELFLLMLKDRKNWVHSKTEEKLLGHTYTTHSYTHSRLDITVKIGEVKDTRERGYSVKGICVSNGEVEKVIVAMNLYQCTDKMLRLERIKNIRNKRIENEKRNADAKRIRDYLEGK